jgi:hypothetical protein
LRGWLQRLGASALLAALALSGSASAQSLPSLPALPGSSHGAVGATGAQPPAGCDPTPLAAVAPSAARLCVARVLVTQDVDAHEQNDSVFTVTDHHATLTAKVPNWWPSGGPVAGMVVTLWGHMNATTRLFEVDRWIDHMHGTGPAPDGPYPQVSALDVASGKVPEHRMVWIATSVFLIDPQQPPAGNDGDIHVQTADGCPAAGVTTEDTPPLRGYVDHPALPGLTSSTDMTDAPSNHLADAPPVGVPVMILGAARYDYGFGWWELHPIRAWRFATPAEAQALAASCGSDPAPQLDRSAPVPVPFGFPPCTDGSEIGTPPGYGACQSQCYVTKTTIDQPEQLAGPCDAIKPIVTPDQESLPQTGTSSTPAVTAGGATAGGATGAPAASPGSGSGGASNASQRAQQRAVARLTLAALARNYGQSCRALKRRRDPYRECLLAMARLAGSEAHAAERACRHESRRRRRGGSDYGHCVAAGRALLRKLAAQRIVEG